MSLTNQEAFNRVWTHFVVEGGKPSFVPDSADGVQCRYRGPDGAKCAFGLLIPDEIYEPGMEGRSASVVFSEYPSVRILLRGTDGEIIISLQDAHDDACRPPGDSFAQAVEQNLRRVASEWDLRIPEGDIAHA